MKKNLKWLLPITGVVILLIGIAMYFKRLIVWINPYKTDEWDILNEWDDLDE